MSLPYLCLLGLYIAQNKLECLFWKLVLTLENVHRTFCRCKCLKFVDSHQLQLNRKKKNQEKLQSNLQYLKIWLIPLSKQVLEYVGPANTHYWASHCSGQFNFTKSELSSTCTVPNYLCWSPSIALCPGCHISTHSIFNISPHDFICISSECWRTEKTF